MTIDASLYLHPQTLARLGSLELRAKAIVEGVMSGAHRSPYQGSSVEFNQHRQYVAGDDIRRLDWKVFGRTDKLQVKQFRQETNLDLIVLLDASGSMRYGSRLFSQASGTAGQQAPDGRSNWSKFDHATAIAAAMSAICLRQGDRVGLAIYADELMRFVRPSSAPGTWRAIVNHLAQHPIDKPTNLPRAVDQLLGKLSGRCIVAVVSDLLSDAQQLRDALAKLKFRGHDAVVLQVLDQAETAFAFEDETPFEGLEGEATVKVNPEAIREAYLKLLNDHLADVEKLTRSFGYDHARISTHDWLGPPLSAFLASREARLRRAKRQ
jgi:uncharacterized protein (DUF58 family)